MKSPKDYSSAKIKQNKKKIRTMGCKTQNDDFIISYSKFLDLKFMDQCQSLPGSSSEMFSPFLLILVDLLQVL